MLSVVVFCCGMGRTGERSGLGTDEQKSGGKKQRGEEKEQKKKKAKKQKCVSESSISVYTKNRTFKDHVVCVSFSRDGKLWASGSYDHTVVLRERKTNKLQVLRHSGGVVAVCFSRCGEFLFSGSWDDSAIVWRVSTGEQVREMKCNSEVWSLAVSQSGDYLFCGGFGGGMTKWHWQSGRKVLTMKGHTYGVSSLVVSLCDGFVMSGSYDWTVRVWKADEGVCVRTLEGHTGDLRAVVLTPSGEVLASAGADSTIRLWKWRSGEAVGVLREADWVLSLAVSLSGKYLLAGCYGSISVWDLKKRALIQRLAAHDDAGVHALATSPCGNFLLSGSDDKTVVEWKGISVCLSLSVYLISVSAAPHEWASVFCLSYAHDLFLLCVVK